MPDTEKLVTIGRLKALLDAYGASPAYWPEEERTAAAALIETSPKARMMLEEAAALDALLDKIPEPEVSAALTSRVRAMAFPTVGGNSNGIFARLADFPRPRSTRGWQGAVAMASVLGMVAGIGLSPMVFDRTSQTSGLIALAPPEASPVTTVVAIDLPASIGTATALLTPDINAISLTGDDEADSIDDRSDDAVDNLDTDSQSDIGEFTVAGVPLY